MTQVEQADGGGGLPAESAQTKVLQAFLSHVRIEPASLNGLSSPPTGVITLNEPAPPGGLLVDLASNLPSVVSVPDKPVVPEGAISTVFEPVVKGTPTATKAVITARVGEESTSTEMHVSPDSNATSEQSAAKEQLRSMQPHTDIAPTPANGTATPLEAATPLEPKPGGTTPIEAKPAAPAPADLTVDQRVAKVLAQLAGVRLQKDDQAIVADLVRALDEIGGQRMYNWLGDVELATSLLLGSPPQVDAARAILANLDKKLNERSAVGFLRRNTPMANVAFGLATLIVIGSALVALLAPHLTPDTTKIAGMDSTILVLVGVAGALGSVVSVMYRIDSFDDTAPRNPLGAYFSGLFKPIIGVGFGLFVFVALSAKVTTLIQPAPGTEPYFYAALGFIAGFVEKFAPDLITKAADTIEGSNNQTPAPSVASAPTK